LYPTQSVLPEAIRTQSITLLNKQLAAAIDLHSQIKQAHWNVRGPEFIAIHELFAKVAGEVEVFSDQLAERVGVLGGTASGTIQVAVQQSFLIPYSLGIADEPRHVYAIVAVLAAFGRSINEAGARASAMGDTGTVDLFAEMSLAVDQELWFVESHIPPTATKPRRVGEQLANAVAALK
jgi:starvation-inducible DNA-binding protein